MLTQWNMENADIHIKINNSIYKIKQTAILMLNMLLAYYLLFAHGNPSWTYFDTDY